MHRFAPTVYEPTTTGPGRVGLRLKPKLFLNRDHHATHDRVEQTIFTWTGPDPAALSEACAQQDSVPFEIRAKSISVCGARQLKHNSPVRFGVAEVEVECSDLTGAWVGRWASRELWVGGDLHVELEQNGSALTGTVGVTGSRSLTRCLTRGVVSGTVSNAEATFGAVQGEHTITFSASLAAASSLSGLYAATIG